MLLDYLPNLCGGILVTVEITVAAALLALALAVPAGLLRMNRSLPVSVLATCYIELFRGTSLVVQLFWLYFVLPQLGLSLSAMTVAIVGIGLNYGAYGAEIVRGAVTSVAKGQREAAAALGLGRWHTFLLVILPQAMVIFVRPWGNLMIQLLKATSLVSLITIADLTYRAYQLNQLTMRTAQIFGFVLIVYFVLAQILVAVTALLDARIGRWRTQESPT